MATEISNSIPLEDKTPSANPAPGNTAAVASAASTVDAPTNPIPDPCSQLSNSEATILNRQVETIERKYSIWHIYRYATKVDAIIVVIAAIASCASGAALPLMTIIFGGLQGTFQDYLALQKITKQEFQREIAHFVLYFVYLGIGSFFTTYISIVGFLYTGEHIATNLGQQYFESCLRQNIAFFDGVSAGNVASKITTDANKIQDGISEKIGLLLASLATLVTGFLIGSVFIALLLNTAFWGFCIRRYTVPVTQAAVKSSTLAQEVFSAIRIAIAFGSQHNMLNQYYSYLKASQTYTFRIKAAVGLMLAVYMGIMPLTYGLGFWQGSIFLARDELRIEQVVTTILAVIIGSFNVGAIGPYLQALIDALSAASRLLVVIDRQTPLDIADGSHEKPLDLKGNLRFDGVKHLYPSRPDTTVLDGLDLDISAGKVTALVGASGSGKSTIIGLIERFYEPVQGVISLDGLDISKLSLGWLRRQIGVVGQEPVLFSGSISDNIRHGLIGSKHENANEDAQRDLIIAAAKTSRAHDFISQLNDGYATDVGQRGLLLSGGQKQRIAIARAIVSNPKILLLDEATSALDMKSETVVQSALDEASLGRTTVVIAHRLSTVRNADTIIHLSEGKIVEQGSHDELLQKRGAYYELVNSQSFQSADEESNSSSDRNVPAHDRLVQGEDLDIVSLSDTSRLQSPSSQIEASLSSTHGEPGTVEVDDQYSFWSLWNFSISFNVPERPLMIIAFFFCIIGGLGTPVQSVFFAKQLMLLSTIESPLHDRWQVQNDSNFWSLMFLMLGIVSFMTYAIQSAIFAYTAESFTRRVKRDTMRHILRQDVGFFDQSVNSPGALMAFLALETVQLTSMSGNLGHLVTSLTIIVGGVSLSLAIGWKLALVCLSVVPLLVCCSILRFFILRKYEGRATRTHMESAAYATEHIAAIRTVASLTLEGRISAQYKRIVEEQRRRGLSSIAKSGAIYAASQSVIMLCLGLNFWYGSTLIMSMEYDIFQFFVCLMSVVFGAQSAGMMLTFVPDIVKARQSATRLKILFDSRPSIDKEEDPHSYGQSLEQTTGRLEFKNVDFRYPSRPEKPVLRDFNLTINPGQHVALVGASGCGKSTVISLLERFYDPCDGRILIDNMGITSIRVQDYRSHFALVSQEPALFQGTIRENISLGSFDESISDQAIKTACCEANVHDFIISLPDGFDTDVGGTGVLLSGGQKQRIAIARALVRRPQILLLDEATSALDSESERVVLSSLSSTAKSRTTITVAHRLTSVINADKIVFLDYGCIVESGTHRELMALGGRYAEMAKLQSLES